MSRSLFRWAVVLTAALSILLLACGPAAEAEPSPVEEPLAVTAQESDPSPTPDPTPTPGAYPTNTPPKPQEVPPTPKPAKTPRPMPTRDPGDPPAPTEPPPPVLPTYEPDPPKRDIPHPDGLAGCAGLNIFSSSHNEFSRHLSWCREAILRDVRDNCQGVGNTLQEKQCAYERLEGIEDYTMREYLSPCAAITNPGDYRQCYDEAIETVRVHSENLYSIWNDLISITSADPDVKTKYGDLNECVREAGHEPPDPNYHLPWQQIDGSKLQPNRGPDAAEEDRAAQIARAQVMNQCGLDTGFFMAQDTAWRSEIHNIFRETPERIRPLKEEGIIDLLNEPGPAPFLQVRLAMSR